MNKTKNWTAQQLAKLRTLKSQGKTHKEIAQAMGRTPAAINRTVDRMEIATPTVSELNAQIEYWKSQAKSIERDLAAAGKSKTAVEMLCEYARELAPKSYTASPSQIALRKPQSHGSPQSAVMLFSDTHIGAVVKPEQTLGLGNYTFDLFLRRLWRMEQSIASILQDHTTTAVPEIVIPMLGDMIDGALEHSAEAGQLNTLLTQFYSGSHAIAQFFRNLSRLAPLRIYGTVGNHTRWQNQKKMPSKNRNSNLDMFLYLHIEALLRDVPTIKFHFDWQPFATFEVQGFNFYCAHGDNIRGGDKMLGIPNHALGRMVGSTTQLFSRAGRETPDYFCLGHLHRGIELPHAKGQVIVNGAFPGIDSYALSEYFNSSHPMQKLFLVHPKYGRAACYDLRLDLGDKTPHSYVLPDTFSCV